MPLNIEEIKALPIGAVLFFRNPELGQYRGVVVRHTERSIILGMSEIRWHPQNSRQQFEQMWPYRRLASYDFHRIA
jgi:hypothetical protein